MHLLRLKKVSFVLLLVFAFLIAGVSYCAADEPLVIEVSPEVRYQVIDGFGASDAWRAQFVGKNWPMAKREQIADLLFSREVDEAGNPKGIGLSLWRFYLSAGTAEQGRESGIANPWRRGECFLSADGSYSWDRQTGQKWFLQAAKKRGVEKLLMFPNAAPVYYSANGKGFADKGNIHMNIKPGYMDDYARYMADVLEHFAGEGVAFDYLSPVNEPQWEWCDGGQEGTPALNEEIYELVKELSGELAKRNLKTKIVIGEAGTIGHCSLPMDVVGKERDGRDDQMRFFFSEDSPFYIGGLSNVEKTISAHSYFTVWPVDKQIEYRKLAHEYLLKADTQLGYWMSEYCVLQENDELGSGGGRDLSMKTSLYVARIIHHDLTIMNAKSWQWWTAITQCDFKDGLVYLDDGSEGSSGRMGWHVRSLQNDGAVRDSKLLWTLGNYSRFVRPGMVRMKCELSQEQSPVDGLLVSAYAEPATDKQVYVFTNLSGQNAAVCAGDGKRVKTYVTDETRNLKLEYQMLDKVDLPARSVVTVICE